MTKTILALMKSLSLIVLSFIAASAMAQNLADLTWKDKNLRACVEQAANKNGWTQASQVTKLKCHKKKIVSANELNVWI